MKIPLLATSSVLLMTLAIDAKGQTSDNNYDNCANIVSASNTKTEQTYTKDTFETHAHNFCHQYHSRTGTTDSALYGASYQFMAESMGNSSASQTDVWNRYCSDESSTSTLADAYRIYIESIAPKAYDAYIACVQASNKGTIFDVKPAGVLATHLDMTVHYNTDQRNSSVDVGFGSPQDVTFNWEQDRFNWNPIDRGRVRLKGERCVKRG